MACGFAAISALAGSRPSRSRPATPGSELLIEADRKYDHFLPSLNVAADISRDFVLRGAIAKVIARPDIGDLSPGGSLERVRWQSHFHPRQPDDRTHRSDHLRPFRGMVFRAGIGADRRPVLQGHQHFRCQTAEQIPFNQLGLPDILLIGTGAVPTDVFTVTRPVNSDGGTLKGVEVALQMPFRFLPSPLNNFGMLANYTYVDSKIEYPLSAAARRAGHQGTAGRTIGAHRQCDALL